MEFLDFGKHTPYVLSSFSLTLVVMVANVLAARGKLSSRLTTLRRRIASEEKT
jgi:heme exporter protein CcmD